MSDPTNPDYYNAGGYEARKVAKAFGFEAYLFNAFKYMCRAGKKTLNPRLDLAKAVRMIQFRIEELEAEDEANASPRKNNACTTSACTLVPPHAGPCRAAF